MKRTTEIELTAGNNDLENTVCPMCLKDIGYNRLMYILIINKQYYFYICEDCGKEMTIEMRDWE